MCNVSRTIRPKGIIKSILSNTITMDVNYHCYQKHMYSFANRKIVKVSEKITLRSIHLAIVKY